MPAAVKREGVTWARTLEDTLEKTYAANHFRSLYLKPLKNLEERILSLVLAKAQADEAAPSKDVGV